MTAPPVARTCIWLLGTRGAIRPRASQVLREWEVLVEEPFPDFDAAPPPALVLMLLGDTDTLPELEVYLRWRGAIRTPVLLALAPQVCAEARAWLVSEEMHPRLPVVATLDMSGGEAGETTLRAALVLRLGAPDTSAQDDARAWRERFARQCALGDVGDYFAILGLGLDAPAGALREAYARTRRDFDAKTCKHAQPSDMEALRGLREVLDEAYAILRDPVRRERYRAALRATPANDEGFEPSF